MGVTGKDDILAGILQLFSSCAFSSPLVLRKHTPAVSVVLGPTGEWGQQGKDPQRAFAAWTGQGAMVSCDPLRTRYASLTYSQQPGAT